MQRRANGIHQLITGRALDMTGYETQLVNEIPSCVFVSFVDYLYKLPFLNWSTRY